jgi:hypothetical protein
MRFPRVTTLFCSAVFILLSSLISVAQISLAADKNVVVGGRDLIHVTVTNSVDHSCNVCWDFGIGPVDRYWKFQVNESWAHPMAGATVDGVSYQFYNVPRNSFSYVSTDAPGDQSGGFPIQATSGSFYVVADAVDTVQVKDLWVLVRTAYDSYTFTTAHIPITVLPLQDGDLGAPGCGEGLCGQPINTTNGNVFLSASDVYYPGLAGGVRLERTWNSLFGTTADFQFGWLARGWMSTYDELLSFASAGKARFYRPDGSSVLFTYNSATQSYDLSAPLNADLTLSYNQSAAEYTITERNGFKHVFDYDGFPLRYVDLNGNTTTLTYQNGLLASITDPAGRHLYFDYTDPNNSVVTNVSSDAGQSWSYEHDVDGNLTKAIFPDGPS